jgi:signal transduction histidine kinase
MKRIRPVSDVVHLLAEIIENATIFSPKDTPVQVSGQELTSGGVLLEVSDNGVGIPEARLTEINWRLDNPPRHRRLGIPAWSA